MLGRLLKEALTVVFMTEPSESQYGDAARKNQNFSPISQQMEEMILNISAIQHAFHIKNYPKKERKKYEKSELA